MSIPATSPKTSTAPPPASAGALHGLKLSVDSGRARRQPISWLDAKEDALAVLAACGMDGSKVQVEAGGPDWFHPGRSGTLKLGPKITLGHFGELHPATLELLDLTGPVAGFEIMLDAIPAPKRKSKDQ